MHKKPTLKLVLIYQLLLASLLFFITPALADTTDTQSSEWRAITADNSQCTGLTFLPDGKIIAGFDKKGLWEYDNNKWTSISDISLYSRNDNKNFLVVNKTGEIAYVEENNQNVVDRFNNNTWSKVIVPANNQQPDSISTLSYDPEGKLIIGTQRGKVYKCVDDTPELIGSFEDRVHYIRSLPGKGALTILTEKPHKHSTRTTEVLQYVDGQWQNIGSFDRTDCTAFALNQDAMPMIAFLRSGVVQYNGNKWSDLGEDTPNNNGNKIGRYNICYLTTDLQGITWALTSQLGDSRLWKFENDAWIDVMRCSELTGSDADPFSLLAIGPNNKMAILSLRCIYLKMPSITTINEVSASENQQKSEDRLNRTTIIIVIVALLLGALWYGVNNKQKKS